MKARQVREWGPPEAMRLAEVPRPKAGQGRALVRVEAAALGVYWGEYERQPETMRAVLADLLATLDRGEIRPVIRRRRLRGRGEPAPW